MGDTEKTEVRPLSSVPLHHPRPEFKDWGLCHRPSPFRKPRIRDRPRSRTGEGEDGCGSVGRPLFRDPNCQEWNSRWCLTVFVEGNRIVESCSRRGKLPSSSSLSRKPYLEVFCPGFDSPLTFGPLFFLHREPYTTRPEFKRREGLLPFT